MIKLNFTGDINDISKGLSILAKDYNYELSTDGLKVIVKKEPGNTLKVSKNGDKAVIEYSEKIHFFRALGLLLEALPNNDTFEINEDALFTMNGAMFDVSQGNSVMRADTVKDYIKRMAVMGLNMLMLYSEDSYDIKEEPYFGYMRARYSHEELKDCDDFADIFGVEMIPCIQTLAHLDDVLKWPVYYDMRDDEQILLVGDEKVYEFIERMIVASSSPFRTKRIHIGMDEAWHLGLGQYLNKYGLRRKFDIMNDHLARVLEIVKKHGLEPMLWSDMYFRAASKSGGYYDEEAIIPEEVINAVPKDVQMVYWDYYHDNEEFYQDFIQRHRKFGSEPIFAGGIWTWTGFTANWGKTFNTTNPALNACKKENIKEVFATIWGDNGTECNIYANLLGLQLFAEHGYARELDIEKLKRRFAFCTGCNYDDFIKMKWLDETPGVSTDNMDNCNASKYLMWQDILTGLFDKNIEGLALDKHYLKLHTDFEKSKERNGDYNFVFDFYSKLAHVLAIKSEIGVKITAAYKKGDKLRLNEILQKELPELELRVKSLRKCHKDQWLMINKALGWEVLDLRYGNLLIRIQYAMERLQDYLDGKVTNIEELDEVREYFDCKPGMVKYANFYDKIVASSRIAAHG